MIRLLSFTEIFPCDSFKHLINLGLKFLLISLVDAETRDLLGYFCTPIADWQLFVKTISMVLILTRFTNIDFLSSSEMFWAKLAFIDQLFDLKTQMADEGAIYRRFFGGLVTFVMVMIVTILTSYDIFCLIPLVTKSTDLQDFSGLFSDLHYQLCLRFAKLMHLSYSLLSR